MLLSGHLFFLTTTTCRSSVVLNSLGGKSKVDSKLRSNYLTVFQNRNNVAIAENFRIYISVESMKLVLYNKLVYTIIG